MLEIPEIPDMFDAMETTEEIVEDVVKLPFKLLRGTTRTLRNLIR